DATGARTATAHVQEARLSAPLPLTLRLSCEPSRLRDVVGDTGGDERRTGGMPAPDVAPVAIGDQSGAAVWHVTVAHMSGTFGAQCRVGRRIRPGLGEDVAPVAEGVSPGAQVEGFELGESAEAPAGSHEGADVLGGRCGVDVVPGC